MAAKAPDERPYLWEVGAESNVAAEDMLVLEDAEITVLLEVVVAKVEDIELAAKVSRYPSPIFRRVWPKLPCALKQRL
jgi:hypothetical protein